MKSPGVFAAFCLGGVLSLAAMPVQAQTLTSCVQSVRTDNRSLNPGYVECEDPVAGLTLAGAAALQKVQSRFGRVTWQLLGLSTDPGSDPFREDPFDLSTGTLLLKTARADLFVVGLQAIGDSAFYLFDYTTLTATDAIAFDTLGIDATLQTGPPLEVAAIYQPVAVVPPPPSGGVPEPAAWALTLAGLGALAARRRDRAA